MLGFENVLGAIKMIKYQIQCRYQSLLNFHGTECSKLNIFKDVISRIDMIEKIFVLKTQVSNGSKLNFEVKHRLGKNRTDQKRLCELRIITLDLF